MVQIIWVKRAIADLDSIGKYIGRDSEYEAQKFVQELIKKADSLISYPEKGRPIPEKIPWKLPADTLQELSDYL